MGAIPTPFSEAMQPALPRLHPISGNELVTMDIPERKRVLSPWLPEKGLTMLHAARGVGKTHVALAAAFAVASGGAVLKWSAPEPAHVLIVDGEMALKDLQDRLSSIARAHADAEAVLDRIHVIAADHEPEGVPDLTTKEGQAALDAALGEAQLVILDNLSTLCRAGRENEAESWDSMQAYLLDLRRRGLSVLIVHHSGKGGAGQRGTSKREDVLDSIVRLKRPDDYAPDEGARFEVHYDKARGFFGAEAAPFVAQLDPETNAWRVTPLSNARDSEIMTMAAEGVSQRKIAKKAGCGVATVNRVIQRERPDGAAAKP